MGYADDVALLVPPPSAMCGLLREWETFASEFGLTFNASKTQLIYFRRFRARSSPPCGMLDFHSGSWTVSIIWGTCCTTFLMTLLMLHTFRLSLTCRKANYLLHVLHGCDPIVKTKLIVSHCLALYGCVLRRLDC